MSETPPREWRFFLEDMIVFAMRVMEYTDGLDQDGFVTSQQYVRAAAARGRQYRTILVVEHDLGRQCARVIFTIVTAAIRTSVFQNMHPRLPAS